MTNKFKELILITLSLTLFTITVNSMESKDNQDRLCLKSSPVKYITHESQERNGLINSPFKYLASELIVMIGGYLYDQDFASMACTSYSLSNIIMYQSSELFTPKDQNELQNKLQNTSFENLQYLALKGSRAKKQQLLSFLRELSQHVSNHKYSIPMSKAELDQKMANFIMLLKCQFISYYLHPEQSKNDVIKIIKSKIRAFRQDPEGLSDCPDAMLLKTTQGIFVSQDLFKVVTEWHPTGPQEEIKRKALDQQRPYGFVTKFLTQFEVR